MAFYSRQLRGPELRYSISEKEALAVVSSLDHFDCYLYGRSVDVITDHKPNLALVSGASQSGLNPRLRRFSLRLMGRVNRMCYLPGPELSSADGLSRMWGESKIEEEGFPSEKGGPTVKTAVPLEIDVTEHAQSEKGGCGAPAVPTEVDVKEESPGVGGAT